MATIRSMEHRGAGIPETTVGVPVSAARRWLPLAAVLAVIAFNAAANLVPIGGVGTGEVSARYPTGFTPAGWVFSIWTLIYAGLIAFGLYAARTGDARQARVQSIVTPFLVSCLANIAWIFAWHYEVIALSVGIMLVLLGSLIVIYARLRRTAPADWAERLAVDAPFSLYLGWVTTATLANLAAWFHDLGTYPFALGRDDWALFSLVTAVGIYTAVGVRFRDAIYAAVLAWASVGIVLQPLTSVGPAARMVAVGACAVAAVVVIDALIRRSRRETRASVSA